MGDGIAAIAFLAGSSDRVAVFEELRRSGPVERTALGDRVDASRTTVGRNLESLEERGWIRRTEEGYELTTIGEVIATDFRALVETMETAERIEPFMRWMPAGAFDLDLRHLANADVTIGDPEDPYAVESVHVERVETANSLRLVLPLVGQRGMRTSLPRVMEGEQTVELILKPEVAELFDSHPEYASMCEKLLRTDGYEMFVYDGEIPYYLGLLDGTVQVGTFDDDGMPRAMLEADSATICEWAEDTYTEYRRESRSFP